MSPPRSAPPHPRQEPTGRADTSTAGPAAAVERRSLRSRASFLGRPTWTAAVVVAGVPGIDSAA